MGYVWIPVRSKPVGHARKHLDVVARLVPYQDVLGTSSCLERKCKVLLCHQFNQMRVEGYARNPPEQERRRGPATVWYEPEVMLLDAKDETYG